mmetsp:Transcript_17050/g.39764  ORF Transcript_17050/g.39764 Transcript_17050/m.39764 type:complete len:387 (+) Transcript_17050:105-1265(+)
MEEDTKPTEDETKAKREARAAMLAETTRRSDALKKYMDLIPSVFYLGEGAIPTLDPGKAKLTSEMLMEASRTTEVEKAKAIKKDKKRKRAKSCDSKDGSQEPPVDTKRAETRAELHRRLQSRIAELKEERRRKQSETDKAKAAEVRARRAEEAKQKAESGEAPASNGETVPAEPQPRKELQTQKPDKAVSHQKAKAPKDRKASAETRPQAQHTPPAASPAVERRASSPKPVPKKSPTLKPAEAESIETGRLSFEPKVSDLPFQTGRSGSKAQHIKKAVRQAEEEERKLSEADEDAKQSLGQELGMKKALARARGEKVHDDLTKLRKSQKAMDMKKKKSKEKWQARMQDEDRQRKEKQQQRKDNLQERANKKKAKRLAKQGEWVEDE